LLPLKQQYLFARQHSIVSEKTYILKNCFVIYQISCNKFFCCCWVFYLFIFYLGHQVHVFSYCDSSSTLQTSLPISQFSTQNCSALLALIFFYKAIGIYVVAVCFIPPTEDLNCVISFHFHDTCCKHSVHLCSF